MKRKIFFVILGYLILGFTITTINSCNLKYDAIICDISFTGIDANNTEPDDLTGIIGFEIYSEQNCKTAFNFNLFPTANATTKCADWQNDLEVSSYSLRLDKQIIFDSVEIPPDTDILKIAGLQNELIISKEKECKVIMSTIVFPPALKEKITFESGIYNVTFRCKTTDGRAFSKQRKVIFKK